MEQVNEIIAEQSSEELAAIEAQRLAEEQAEAERVQREADAETERAAAAAAVGYWKDADNTVHFLDNGSYRHLLPRGEDGQLLVVKITDEEGHAIEAAARAAQEAAAALLVPEAVDMRQARLALLSVGKYAAVNEAINAMPSPAKEAAQIEWEFAATVRRDSPLIAALAPAIGLDDAAVDALFRTAAKL